MLLHELISVAAARSPHAPALVSGRHARSYEALALEIAEFAWGVLGLNVSRGDRVGIYLEKRPETVVASFGAPAAGAVFVPLNPLLKPLQVAYIIRDCSVRVLVTSFDRVKLLEPVLSSCPDLQHVVVVGETGEFPTSPEIAFHRWHQLLQAPARR
ncbi:MAG: AMP-binding protein, partial [Burkholderiales bacterium]